MCVQVENVVTKRSAEATGPGQFDTSEFSKQVQFLFHESLCRGIKHLLCFGIITFITDGLCLKTLHRFLTIAQ